MYLFMGLQYRLLCEFDIIRSQIKLYGFYTTSSRANGYIEFTPYNKGNLWKIRFYGKMYKVFYGTKDISYTTSLQDCITLINQSRLII